MTPFQIEQQEKTRIKNNFVLDLIQTIPLTVQQIQSALHHERKNYADIIKRLLQSDHIAEAGYDKGAKNKRAMSYLALKKEFTPPPNDNYNHIAGAKMVRLTDTVYWAAHRRPSNYGVSGSTLSGTIYS